MFNSNLSPQREECLATLAGLIPTPHQRPRSTRQVRKLTPSLERYLAKLAGQEVLRRTQSSLQTNA